MTTVLLVDDHPVFRRGLASLLTAEGMRVVGEAACGAEAIEAAARLRPDVVVMDLGLPDVDGLTATRQILNDTPDSHIIVISMYHDDAALARALETGAHGYVPKDASPDEVVAAVRLVAAGGLALSAQLATRIPHLVAGGTVRSSTVADSQFPQLSAREREVLGLLADNLPNPLIAARLGLSAKTVANYMSTICMRLGVADRHAAAQLARQARDTQRRTR